MSALRLEVIPSALVGLRSALVCLILAACVDLPETTDVDPRDQVSSVTGEQDTVRSIGQRPSGAFAVSVQVGGPLRPGSTVDVSAFIDPLVPVEDVVASVFAPEVEYVKATGAGRDYRIPENFVGPAVKRVDHAGRMRGRLILNASVEIEHPGAYEIIVKVVGETLIADPRVSGDVRRSVWVYVSEEGGSVSEQFDATRLPDGTVKAPGPRRDLPTRPGGSDASPSSKAAADWNTVTVHMYYNDGSTPRPVQGALVILYEYTDTWGGQLWDKQWGVTDANGNVTFLCYAWHVTVEPTLTGTQLWMSWTQGTTDYVCDQGVPTLDVNAGTKANVFNNYENDVIPTVDGFLNDSRSSVEVIIDWDPESNSRYCSLRFLVCNDNIYISINHIWRKDVQAHEYGHAIHEKGLGGFANGTCGGSHTYRLKTNYTCAWAEGFAQFIAEATGYGFRSSSGYVDRHCLQFDFETFTCTEEGTVDDHLMVEGAVMEFLWDLVDSDNTETYDNVTMASLYVADIIETCKVDGSRPQRIHYLIHCVERRISGYSSGFPPSEQPSSFSVSSGHSLNADEVTRLWMWHFFNSVPGDPPPPPPPSGVTVTINGPTTMRPNTECFYSSSVSGGTTPYSYQWYQGSTPVGTGSSVTVSSSGYVSSFRLSLSVTDAAGASGSDEITVQISESAPICPS